MKRSTDSNSNVLYVTSFEELISTRFHDGVNAICWRRKVEGDFSEIVEKIDLTSNIAEVSKEALQELQLSDKGKLARELLLSDLELLAAHGASPILNVIRNYERDDDAFFSTDVYSFHVDRSPIPVDTILCTYYGAPSEILKNSLAEQKILVPEIRTQLLKLYDGPEDAFESFLSDHFFDLHYQARQGANIISLGTGQMWRLATDHPGNEVLPCVHRAPKEKPGEKRLLLIC